MSTTIANSKLLTAWRSQGDTESFRILCERHLGLVESACRRAGSPDVADAVQAVFLVLARRAGSIPGAKLGGWLTTTAHQVVRHQHRASTRRRRHEQEAAMEHVRRCAADGADPSWEEARQHLDAALASLSPGRREAILRFYLAGIPQAEVAAELGCSVDAVKTRVHEGLAGLRTYFARKGIALGVVALTSGLASEAIASDPTLVTTAVQTVLTPAAAPSAAALAHGVTTAMIIKTAMLAAAGLVLAGSCLTAALVLGAESVPTPVVAGAPRTSVETLPTVKASNLGEPESQPAFPLERRIRAQADGRQVQTTMRFIAAPAAFWSGLGLAGDGPQVLGSAQAARVLAAASTDPLAQVVSAPRLRTLPLQRGKITICNQYAYIADYGLVNGVLDPVVSVLNLGQMAQCSAEPVADSIVLVETGVTSVQLLGTEIIKFSWPVNGVDKSYALEMPVCLIEEGKIAPETRLGPGEAVAVPLVARVQRSQPKFLYAIEHGTIDQPIPDPDLKTRPRSVCLLTAEDVTSWKLGLLRHNEEQAKDMSELKLGLGQPAAAPDKPSPQPSAF